MRVALSLLILCGTPLAAAADPSIVIPGRRGVPIIINGIDASYAVVEGDWGLGKGVHVQPTIYGGVPADPDVHVGHYYPSAGAKPGYGRLEIEPPRNRKLPRPAESYQRSWSSSSAPLPAQSSVPVNPPDVIVAPQFGAYGPYPGATASPPHDFGQPQEFRQRSPRFRP